MQRSWTITIASESLVLGPDPLSVVVPFGYLFYYIVIFPNFSKFLIVARIKRILQLKALFGLQDYSYHNNRSIMLRARMTSKWCLPPLNLVHYRECFTNTTCRLCLWLIINVQASWNVVIQICSVKYNMLPCLF